MTDSTAIVANTAVEKAVAQKMATFFKDVLKKRRFRQRRHSC